MDLKVVLSILSVAKFFRLLLELINFVYKIVWLSLFYIVPCLIFEKIIQIWDFIFLNFVLSSWSQYTIWYLIGAIAIGNTLKFT